MSLTCFLDLARARYLRTGSTIAFYVSREKVLIGEGKVKDIEKLNPEVAWSRYKNRIFFG
jgi:hypothetical protein